MPYISPAAIGWMVVRLRGEPSVAKRSPIARSMASGQPKPLDELTVTVAPSAIRRAASASEMTLLRGIVALDFDLGGSSFADRHLESSVRNRRWRLLGNRNGL